MLKFVQKLSLELISTLRRTKGGINTDCSICSPFENKVREQKFHVFYLHNNNNIHRANAAS